MSEGPRDTFCAGDGEPTGARYGNLVALAFYRHPRTAQRGLLAHRSTESMPRGRHLLGVTRDPSGPDLRAADAAERRRFVERGRTDIPCWR